MIIKTPSPSRLFRMIDEGKRDDKKTEFLGWGNALDAPRFARALSLVESLARLVAVAQ